MLCWSLEFSRICCVLCIRWKVFHLMSRLLIERVLPRAIVQSWSLPGALVKETQKIVWRSDWNSVRLFRRFFLKNLFIQLFFDVFFLRCRRRCLPRPTSGPHIPSGSVSNPFLCVCRVAHAPYPMCSRVTDRLVRLYNFQTFQTRAQHSVRGRCALPSRASNVFSSTPSPARTQGWQASHVLIRATSVIL